MTKISPDFADFQKRLLSEVESVHGYLGEGAVRFLSLLAAYPTAKGEILEIGTFKGKSTIVLAKASRLAGSGIVHAVDPMIAPSETDPDLDEGSSFPEFEENIKAHGVGESIKLHQMRSEELAATWDKPLRLLWIDGDHTYKGAKLDFDCFKKHLSDGAIVAIDDVLHEFEGGLRVFVEDILLSPEFGACGVIGSLAWAQFHKDTSETKRFHANKLLLYKRMSKLIPYVAFNKKLEGIEKKKYKLLRSRVPRHEIIPQKWIEMVMCRS